MFVSSQTKEETELTEKNAVLNKTRKHDTRETNAIRQVQELYYHLAIRGTKQEESLGKYGVF